MSSTARSGRRSPHRTAALLAGSVVTVVAAALLPLARQAGADTLSNARAQAAQVNAELQADSAKLDALDQQYELAQEQVSAIQGQITQVRASIAQEQSQVTADQASLRSEALQSYETGASDSGLGVFSATGEQAAVTSEYKQLAANSVTDAIDALQVAEAKLNAEQAQLQASDSQAQAALNQATAARNAAGSTAASEKATLRSLNGQISQLVAQQNPPRLGGASFPNPPPNGAAATAVQAAESQIGVPYQWGAESPGQGFDCSGLTQWSWRQAGVSIPRTADAQYQSVARVPLSAMEPGDLVFWGSGGYAQHVAIYIGNGDVVDAPSSGQDVQEQPIWSNGLLGAGRP